MKNTTVKENTIKTSSVEITEYWNRTTLVGKSEAGEERRGESLVLVWLSGSESQKRKKFSKLRKFCIQEFL